MNVSDFHRIDSFIFFVHWLWKQNFFSSVGKANLIWTTWNLQNFMKKCIDPDTDKNEESNDINFIQKFVHLMCQLTSQSFGLVDGYDSCIFYQIERYTLLSHDYRCIWNKIQDKKQRGTHKSKND